MPLTSSSPLLIHILQNVALVLLSLVFLPVVSLRALNAHLFVSLSKERKTIENAILNRQNSDQPCYVILVTGISMSKGLFLARAFYEAGHTVIGADFEPHGIPASGRYSKAITRFYRVPTSRTGDQLGTQTAYGEALVDIIQKEKINLWVSCSGVASAMDDAHAAELVQEQTSCKAIQFNTSLTQTLHEKDSFIRQAASFDLNIPDTYTVSSVDDAMWYLYYRQGVQSTIERRYIMKPVGMDDARRADMTLLPSQSSAATRSHLERLEPSKTRQFVLQQFIQGEEYCTHSVVVNGQIVAFISCASAELLMHYEPLHPSSTIAYAMLRYTQKYVERLGDVTGHFSIDFMLDTSGPEAAYERDWEGVGRLYPIECNPRAHTAVVLFAGYEGAMVDGYLRAIDPSAISTGEKAEAVIPTPQHATYWIGHDLVALVILPFFSFLTFGTSLKELLNGWQAFLTHIFSPSWKDGTFEAWDPWPFWWLYAVYWPGRCLMAIWHREWWSRANVSTGKMFRC